MLVSDLFNTPKHPLPSRDILNRRKSTRLVTSEQYVGVEIELEGCKDNWRYGPTFERYWSLKPEGSIRETANGVGIEYVFKNPLLGKQITGALRIFSKRIKEMQADPSWRCGTHVHINMTDSTIDDLMLFLWLYIIFEPAIYKYVGDARRKSPFCVPISADSDNCAAIIDLFKQAREFKQYNPKERAFALARNSLIRRVSSYSKYNGLNLKSLSTLGTVEFRMAPSMVEYDDIVNWINILLCFKKTALEMNHDDNMLLDFHNYISQVGVRELARGVFGEALLELLDYPEFEEQCMENARLLQHIILATHREEIINDASAIVNPIGLREKFNDKFTIESGPPEDPNDYDEDDERVDDDDF